MGEEQASKVEVGGEEANMVENWEEVAAEPPTEATEAEASETTNNVAEEKALVAEQDEKAPEDDGARALALVDKPLLIEEPKSWTDFADRDVVLTRVETEKRMSLIKAWEENEKARVENRAMKKHSAIGSWEDTAQASLDEKLKQIEERLEKLKAKCVEKKKKKVAMILKKVEERRALIEAKKGEEIIKAGEKAAKYRAIGHASSKRFGCF